jgi:uncharacterized membrane protein
VNKKRLRNYGLWVAVASFVALNLGGFGIDIDLGFYDRFVNGLLGILVLLGVISNPTNPESKGFNL